MTLLEHFNTPFFRPSRHVGRVFFYYNKEKREKKQKFSKFLFCLKALIHKHLTPFWRITEGEKSNFFEKRGLQIQKPVLIYISLMRQPPLKPRGISAVGSAQHWQCWGQEFESPMLHQMKTLEAKASSVFLFAVLRL